MADIDDTSDLYDDSPWSDEEMEALAWEAGCQMRWDEMDEYNIAFDT